MEWLMLMVFIVLACGLLANKFGGPQRAGEPDEAWAIRRRIWRVLKIVGLSALIPVMLFGLMLLLMGLYWRGC